MISLFFILYLIKSAKTFVCKLLYCMLSLLAFFDLYLFYVNGEGFYVGAIDVFIIVVAFFTHFIDSYLEVKG